MKYNCLRINPYVKMFVVGLLLYFGETVFSNATEKEGFTVKVKTLTGLFIEVSGCKKNDKLSGFMKKFEEAYEGKKPGEKIKELKYRVVYNRQLIVKDSQPVKDISLAELKIYDNSVLTLVFPLKNLKKNNKLPKPHTDNKTEDKLLPNIKKEIINEKHRKDSEILILQNDTFPQNITTIDPQNDKAHPNSEFASKEENLTNLGNENIHKNPTKLLPVDNLKKKKIPATSTCPCRRVCRLCGC